MTKKVLLTGATGFIGRNAIPALLANGYEVHATTLQLDISCSQNVHWHACDLLNPLQTSALLKEVSPSHLLHFAWYAIPGKYWTSPANVDWVQASLHLIRQFAMNGGDRVVIAGTCAEYDWNKEICSEKTTPLSPTTLYGTSKAALYQILDSFTQEIDLSFAWGRIFFLYGPHEYPKRLVPSVVQSLLKKEVAKCSHGAQIRDFMHVEDVANAFVTLLDSEVKGAINIASGRPISLKTVVQHIAENLQAETLVEYGAVPTTKNEAPCIVAEVTRLTNELGWHPKYTLEGGLQHVISWWKKQNIVFSI